MSEMSRDARRAARAKAHRMATGTSGKVDAYMAELAVLHLIVSKLLPVGAWREAFQYITIGGKLNATIGNASIGIHMEF